MRIVVGAPFAGKRLWIDREIEKREAAGEVGLLALDFTGIYSAIVPGLASVYRDERITDSGAARFAGWLHAAAVREAADRELDGYVATDSPRRALALAAAAPRAAADDGAAARCRQMVETYFAERPVLPADTQRVRAPEVPSDRAIQYAWSVAIRAAKRGDTAKRDKWTAAARRMLAARGIGV